MAIIPENTDWTRVLEHRCPQLVPSAEATTTAIAPGVVGDAWPRRGGGSHTSELTRRDP